MFSASVRPLNPIALHIKMYLAKKSMFMTGKHKKGDKSLEARHESEPNGPIKKSLYEE